MGKNGNKKDTNSPNAIDFSKNGVYCNDLMLKTAFTVMILKIKQYEKYTLVEFRQNKVWYVPGIRRSTQYSFSAKTTV